MRGGREVDLLCMEERNSRRKHVFRLAAHLIAQFCMSLDQPTSMWFISVDSTSAFRGAYKSYQCSYTRSKTVPTQYQFIVRIPEQCIHNCYLYWFPNVSHCLCHSQHPTVHVVSWSGCEEGGDRGTSRWIAAGVCVMSHGWECECRRVHGWEING
jgi:hypothetical protein